MRPILLRILFGNCVVLFILGGVTSAATQTARVTGRTAADLPAGKRVLEGVPITLTNAIGGVRETLSDEAGNYTFADLVAGDYTLRVTLAGFEPFERRIPVQFGATVEINIELKPIAVSESVEVTDRVDPDVARDESSVPATVTNQTLQNAPLIDERFQDALPLIPGVVRGPDGLLNVKGARATQSGVLVSSLNVTDPVTGAAAIALPIEAVETVQVYSNPYSAEYGRFAGAVVQIETRAGTNEFKFAGSNILPRLRRRDGAIIGIEAFVPRIAFGGPVRKDKLFFFQSFEYRFVRTPNNNLNLPPLRRDTRFESFDSFTRIDYALNARNRLTASLSIFPQKFDFFNFNSFNPQQSTANFHQGGFFLAVNEQAVFGRGLLLQSNLSVKDFDARIFPNGEAPYVLTSEGNRGNYFNRQDRTSRRYELLETLSLPTANWRGTHQIKLGVNLSRTSFRGTDTSRTVLVTDSLFPLGFVPSASSELFGVTERVEFTGTGQLAQNNFETALFVQNKWMPVPRVTLDLGLRFDRDQLGRDNNNFAPRFGFAVVPTRDLRTIVRGGVGLFYDKIPLAIGVFEDFQDRRIFDATPSSNLPGAYTLVNLYANPNLRAPRSTAFSIQVDRELNSRVIVRASYEERRTARDFLIEPVLPVACETGTPDFSCAGALLLRNAGRSRYRELQFLSKLRLQERRDIVISYARARAEADTNDFNSYFGNLRTSLIRPNEYTRTAFDVPHRFLAYADLGLPFDITVLPVVDWRSGFPYSLVDVDQNFVGERNRGGRFPAFFSLDVQATIGVRVPFRGKTYRGRAGFKIFNITNHFNPRDVQNNIDSQSFGGFYNSVNRQFRLKFEFLKF